MAEIYNILIPVIFLAAYGLAMEFFVWRKDPNRGIDEERLEANAQITEEYRQLLDYPRRRRHREAK